MTVRFAYVHCKPDGSPFYVGKGSLRRAKYLGGRNQHHAAVVKKYGAKNILIGMMDCSSHEIAYQLEKGIIKCLRRQEIALANYTEGGDGGKNPCEETRKKLSAAAKKRGVSIACQLAKVAAKKGKPLSEAQKIKQSQTMKGIVFTAEHRQNISKSAKKRGMKQFVIEAAKKAIQKKVIGHHPDFGYKEWDSAKSVALDLGAPISTTSKKIAAKIPYMGWVLRYSK